MNWVFLAVFGYFFNALSALFDKYLLSERIGAPAVYAFFVALFSLFALFFLPFGFVFVSFSNTVILLCSGFLFVYGLLAFYKAVKDNEISRVAPLLGTVISLVTFLPVFFPVIFEEQGSGTYYLLSLTLLILGGLLISFDLPIKKGEHFSKMVIVGGVLMGVSSLLLKQGFTETAFNSGFIWSRIGMFLGGLSLFIIPLYRKQIRAELSNFSVKPRHEAKTGILFVLNKICAGIGGFLLTYAISLGSLTFVQALSGIQYVFLLFLALPLTFVFPHIYGEKLSFWDWFQKACAVGMIALGLWYAGVSGIEVPRL